MAPFNRSNLRLDSNEQTDDHSLEGLPISLKE